MEHASNFHAVVGEEPDVFENRSTMFMLFGFAP
jgi:hypothetical protein